jgi:hypothetical protein
MKAIDYCTERDLFSAAGLKDTLAYFSQDEPKPAQTKADLPVKYQFVKAVQRSVDYYAAAAQPEGGGSL